MAYKYEGKLSKDLPGGRVGVPTGSKQKSYYKYYLEPCADIPEELKESILAGVFAAGEGIEIADRTRIMEEKAYPARPGYYALAGGGAMSCANVKTPHITGEMLDWWAGWHAIEPLRYAIWNPVDHYGVTVTKGWDRLTDLTLPVRERVWGVEHLIHESMVGDEPGELTLAFKRPEDCGYDTSKVAPSRWLTGIVAQGSMGDVPVFATEILCQGEDGVNEIRCRFWIGYELQDDGSLVCKIPPHIKVPPEMIHHLVMHNYREFAHLDKVLPRLYAEEKDNWL